MVISLIWPITERVVKQTIPPQFIKLIGIAAPRQPVAHLLDVAVLRSIDNLIINKGHIESSTPRQLTNDECASSLFAPARDPPLHSTASSCALWYSATSGVV
mmetsp:Transcript_18143/g.58823  ORF Transcript_18143/g.58823 Transcript_18143/m.58823 type:complete len:102 (+) Transcript_18143:371-676(+)